jgi:hypothetical protein
MATNDKEQPGRDKPNESENQPQYASEQEARPERELGSSEDDDTDESAGSVLPGPNGRPGARNAAGASDLNDEAREALDDEKRPPNADD